jgi:hypothetical protein
MDFFKSKVIGKASGKTSGHKASKGNTLFEKAASDHRFLQELAAKFQSTTKVAKLIPLLLEDDRIACEYADTDKKTGLTNGLKLLAGGYFRFYNPEEGMLYLSPFKKSVQLGLLHAFGKKFSYLEWRVTKINAIYIKNSAFDRVRAVLSSESKRPASTSYAESPVRSSPAPAALSIQVRSQPHQLGYSPGN